MLDCRDTELAVLVKPRVLPMPPRDAALTAALALAMASLSAPPAFADEFDTFNVKAGSLLRYESNVFRLPDGTAPFPGSSQSDTASVSYLGLQVDKRYSMQRFQASVTDTITRYAKFDSLNNDALNYSTAWLWAVTPHLTGTLSADRSQSQVPFSLAGGNQRNIRTVNNRNFTLDFTVSGAWHLLGGMGHSESSTEIPTLTLPSTDSDRAEAGLRYISSAGNTITFMQRWIPADLTAQSLDPVNLIDTNYRDTETELRGDWKLTGKSTVEARAVHKERVNLHFIQRNFSGVAGDLRYIWTPTGKTKLTFALTRDVLPYAAFGNTIENSTYRVDNMVSLLGTWQATAKITVFGNIGRTRSDFRGPVFPLTQPPREDTLTVASLSANWAIARSVSLNALLEHDQRSSNTPGFQFKNNVFLMGASLLF